MLGRDLPTPAVSLLRSLRPSQDQGDSYDICDLNSWTLQVELGMREDLTQVLVQSVAPHCKVELLGLTHLFYKVFLSYLKLSAYL